MAFCTLAEYEVLRRRLFFELAGTQAIFEDSKMFPTDVFTNSSMASYVTKKNSQISKRSIFEAHRIRHSSHEQSQRTKAGRLELCSDWREQTDILTNSTQHQVLKSIHSL